MPAATLPFARIEPLESRIAPAFASVVEASALNGSNGLQINGVAASSLAGISVSSAGDVNGDGIDDVIIGAPGNLGATTSAAYVVFGKATAFSSSLNLSELNGTNGFKITSESSLDLLGISASGAGDVNNDGIDDVIVGASNQGVDVAGAAYVIFGRSTTFPASLHINTLNGTNGFMIEGAEANGLLGGDVSGAGDVNNDGFDDVIVSAPDVGDESDGAAYVILGHAGSFTSVLNVATLTGSNGFRLDGESASDVRFVSEAGDVNNDGFDDVIIGAPSAVNGSGFKAGAAYIVFGKGTAFSASMPLGGLNGTTGTRMYGFSANDAFGSAVGGGGDLNNDGFDDVIIGASGWDAGGPQSGGGQVILGAASFPAVIDLFDLNGSNGFDFVGNSGGDGAGNSVAIVGDINADGFADALVGVPMAGPNGPASGSAFVVFGQATPFISSLFFSGANGTSGYARINGEVADDHFGGSVASAGDFNDDGTADLITGAFRADPNGTNSGAAYVFFGDGPKAPTITAISNREAFSGQSTGQISFTISDDDTALNNLTLSYALVNAPTVSLSSVTFGGAGGARTMDVITALGSLGDAEIVVTVSDGVRTASESFLLTVKAPAITLVVPGILGSWPREHLTEWLSFDTAGVAPGNLQLDPFGHSYANLVASLQQAEPSGRAKIFEAPYDWRRSIDGPATAGAVDIAAPDTGVEYLVYWINEAAQWWQAAGFPVAQFKVDIVAHSMGGIVARALIEAPWFADLSTQPGLAIDAADFVDEFIMLDTPNHGSPDAYMMKTWLDQMPPIVGGIVSAHVGGGVPFAEAIGQLVSYAGQAAGAPAVLVGALVGGLQAVLDPGSFAEAAAASYVDRWTDGARDLFPTWTGYSTGSLSTPPVNSFLTDLNQSANLALLGGRAETLIFTGAKSKPTTTYSTFTIDGLIWDVLNIPLDDLAVPTRKAYGSGAVLYPFGDPLTGKGGDVNEFGAYLLGPGIRNSPYSVEGIAVNRDFLFTEFESHQLFGDSEDVIRTVLDTLSFPANFVYRPFETRDVTAPVLVGIAVDWAAAKVKSLSDVIDRGINAGIKAVQNVFMIWDPADVLLQDGSGRRIGSDGVNTYAEIPGAAHLSDGTNGFIILPNLPPKDPAANVKVKVTGTGDVFQGWLGASNGSASSTTLLGGGTIAAGVTTELTQAVVGTGGVKAVQFTDVDGSLVRVSVTKGAARLLFDGQIAQSLSRGVLTLTGSDIVLSAVELLGTSLKSTLSIKVSGGGGNTLVGRIGGHDTLGTLAAKNVYLAGDGIVLTGDGVIRSVQLNDILDGASIVMPGALASGVKLSIGAVGAVSVETNAGIARLTVDSWQSGSIQAPWIGSLTTTGDKTFSDPGNIGASISLNDATRPHTLGSARVKGAITGAWDLFGNVGSISAGSLDGSAGGALAGFIGTNGRIAKVMIGGDMLGGALQSGIYAGALGQVTIGGDLQAVDPAMPVRILVYADSGISKPVIGGITVRGNVANAQILAGYTSGLAAANPDAGIGSIRVDGNWSASSVAVGMSDATADGFGRNDVLASGDSTPAIFATIASIKIKGSATGSNDGADFFGITAQKIRSASIGGTKLTLNDTADDLSLGSNFRLVDLV